MNGDPNSNLTSRDLAEAIFDDYIRPLSDNADLKLDFKSELFEESYFSPARRPMMDVATMKASDQDTFARLAMLWVGDFADLQQLIDPLEKLADVVARERAEAGATGDDQPSSLIYQMW